MKRLETQHRPPRHTGKDLTMRVQDMKHFISAGYAFFYVCAKEIRKAVDDLKEEIKTLQRKDGSTPYLPSVWNFEENPDPEAVLDLLDGEPTDGEIPVIIAENWHWFLVDEYNKPEYKYVQRLINRESVFTTSENRRIFIIVGKDPFDTAMIDQVSDLFVSLEYDLPNSEEIGKQVDYIIKSASKNPKFKIPSEKQRESIIGAAKGLGTSEAQNALAYSLIKTEGSLDPVIISELKAKEVEKTAGLRIGRYDRKLEDLKGYGNISQFVLSTIGSKLAKGIILLGPPGTGKSTFAQAISAEVGKICFELEVAELFGGLVGDTERLVREVIKVIRANAPCIVFVDELEKALAGSGSNSSGASDAGTTKRAMAQFLKFLSNRTEDGIYVIATCNDITSLDPEWIRPGRWDSAPFYVKLPAPDVRKDIWNHYAKVYDLGKVKVAKTDDHKWTGSEIETCCRIACMTNSTVKEAKRYIVPISKTAEGKVEALNKWAEGKTIPAENILPVAKPKQKRDIDI